MQLQIRRNSTLFLLSCDQLSLELWHTFYSAVNLFANSFYSQHSDQSKHRNQASKPRENINQFTRNQSTPNSFLTTQSSYLLQQHFLAAKPSIIARVFTESNEKLQNFELSALQWLSTLGKQPR